MLDLAYIREKVDLLKDALSRRGYDLDPVDELVELDKLRRSLIHEVEELRRLKNEKSEEVARLKKEGKDASKIIEEMRAVSQKIKELDERRREAEDRFFEKWALIPNIPHNSVPVGRDESENREVRRWGEIKEFDFEPKPHWDIGEELGILDFKVSGKISGSRFFTFKGLGAKLERALISFFLDIHTKENGYKEIFPPVLVTEETMYGSGQLPKFEEEMYRTEGDNLYLIPTAEVVLANLHRDSILNEDELPIYYVAYTPCFRREAGSYGKDVRGMIRVHQFNKVELFKFTKPEDSYDELEKMLNDAEGILRRLDLPYRVIELCTGDLGFAASKTYDLEVWAPGLKRWLEVSSVSNTESFQARRTNTRFRRKGANRSEFPHTLNGSGLATPRTFIAILENYQNADGSVTVPEVLRPYMGGIDVIGRD